MPVMESGSEQGPPLPHGHTHHHLVSVYFLDFYRLLAAKWKEGGPTRRARERCPRGDNLRGWGVCPQLHYSQKTTFNQSTLSSTSLVQSWQRFLPS